MEKDRQTLAYENHAALIINGLKEKQRRHPGEESYLVSKMTCGVTAESRKGILQILADHGHVISGEEEAHYWFTVPSPDLTPKP